MSNPKKITVASYQLDSSFGIFDIQKKNQIIDFREKPILDIWFNGTYRELEKDDYITGLNGEKVLVKKGINTDAKSLGAFYVLAGLTLVNINAATAMPWLYQSVAHVQ